LYNTCTHHSTFIFPGFRAQNFGTSAICTHLCDNSHNPTLSSNHSQSQMFNLNTEAYYIFHIRTNITARHRQFKFKRQHPSGNYISGTTIFRSTILRKQELACHVFPNMSDFSTNNTSTLRSMNRAIIFPML
jgi:peptide subunit release factor RF-3